MTPTHVSIMQCTGSCLAIMECKATKTEWKEVPVMLGKCGIGEGRCEKQCTIVSVEEEVECGCACHLKQSDCGSSIHYLNEDICKCVCRDDKAKRDCLEQ